MRKVQSVFFFPYLTDKRRPDAVASYLRSQTVVITTVLSTSYHRLLNLPDMQCKTQRWHCVGRYFGQALIGRAKKKNHSVLSN